MSRASVTLRTSGDDDRKRRRERRKMRLLAILVGGVVVTELFSDPPPQPPPPPPMPVAVAERTTTITINSGAAVVPPSTAARTSPQPQRDPKVIYMEVPATPEPQNRERRFDRRLVPQPYVAGETEAQEEDVPPPFARPQRERPGEVLERQQRDLFDRFPPPAPKPPKPQQPPKTTTQVEGRYTNQTP
jgi:hypothetical protein